MCLISDLIFLCKIHLLHNSVTKYLWRKITGNVCSTHWNINKINWNNLGSLSWTLQRGRKMVWQRMLPVHAEDLGKYFLRGQGIRSRRRINQVNWNRKIVHACFSLNICSSILEKKEIRQLRSLVNTPKFTQLVRAWTQAHVCLASEPGIFNTPCRFSEL